MREHIIKCRLESGSFLENDKILKNIQNAVNKHAAAYILEALQGSGLQKDRQKEALSELISVLKQDLCQSHNSSAGSRASGFSESMGKGCRNVCHRGLQQKIKMDR